MSFRGRVRKLEEAARREAVILVTDDGEEVPFLGDFGELMSECFDAACEHRPVDHELRPYLERGLQAKDPGKDGTIWGIMSDSAQAHLREPVEDLSE